MNWLDIVILAALGTITLAGWRMGGIHAAVTGAGILLGIALASRLHERVNPLFSRFIESENGAEIAAFIAIFILALIASIMVGLIAQSFLRKLMLGRLDKVVGLGLGVVVTFAIGSAVLSTLQSYPVVGMEDTIDGSTMGSFLADNFDVVLRGLKFIGDDLGTGI